MEPTYATTAPAGGMPTGGEMPSPSGPSEPAGWESPAEDQPVADDAQATAVEAPPVEPVSTPAPAAGVTAPAAAPAPVPQTPSQQELVQAAGHFLQIGQAVQQQLPTVQAQKQALEAVLAPYAQNPALVDGLSPEGRAAIQAQYSQWQQVSMKEQQLSRAWAEVEQNAPVLQAMYQVEQQRAMLNRVGEPMAYQLLAERAAGRSGDPNFPVKEMVDYLKGAPANALEWAAGQFEALHTKQRKATRVEQRVDDMGPAATQGAGADWSRLEPTELFRMDIEREQRKR